MSLKVLAVGDMHLGRRPARLPEALLDQARDLGPAEAWRRVVETAIAQDVNAVALAGDVVEREDDFYEGFRELAEGVKRLKDAGICILGVAGNHDVRVLPRLADQITDFKLLGVGGKWESAKITAGGETLTLWGWSFNQKQVRESPVADKDFERRSGLNLGLLHCDRDQLGSIYAPVTSTELRSTGLDGWLLGHIHVPDVLTPDSPSGYLGSVTALDQGETGAHGPWLITVDHGRILSLEQQVLAPLRWELLDLDLSDIGEAEDARSLLLDHVRELDAALASSTWEPKAVGLCVRLTGRCNFGSQVAALFDNEELRQIITGDRGTYFFLGQVRIATNPKRNLDELATQIDPPGLLARRLLLLDRPETDTERQALLEKARRKIELRWRDPRWQDLRTETLNDDTTADWLRRAGIQLLEHMLAQREV